MNKGNRGWSALFIIISLLLGTACSRTDKAGGDRSFSPAEVEAVMGATVQITMFKRGAEDVAAQDERQQEVVGSTVEVQTHIARGIGTLVQSGQESLLITHDHWPSFKGPERPDRVQFHDAEGMLLLEQSGEAFAQNMLFHDSGSLILRAPGELLTADRQLASFGPSQPMSVGDVVTVVKRDLNNGQALVLVEARVQSVSGYPGTPRMELQTLDGQSVEPGDSGGGIWTDGQLLGNMWMTIREAGRATIFSRQPTISQTDRSVAAIMTGDLMELLQEIQQPAELPPQSESSMY